MKTRVQAAVRFSIAGSCALALAILAFGQGSYLTSLPNKFEVGPHPRDFVQIKEGTTYTVPAGRILVLTALGGRERPPDCCPIPEPWELRINDVPRVRAGSLITHSHSSMLALAPGLTAAGGAEIDLSGGGASTSDGRAWGYLSDPLPPGMDGDVTRVPYLPHPSDMVQFHAGAFFIVPAGKRFVLTGLGNSAGWGVTEQVSLRVNAQTEVSTNSTVLPPDTHTTYSTDATTVRAVPIGFAAPGGSIMEVVGGVALPVSAWGYLANE